MAPQTTVAVMAACDRVALGVLEACREAKLDVPGKVAVLSVDNDEIICEFARPSLTSIIHDPVPELGRKAGEAMNTLLRGRRSAEPGLVEFNRMKVIERESCAHLPQTLRHDDARIPRLRRKRRRSQPLTANR